MFQYLRDPTSLVDRRRLLIVMVLLSGIMLTLSTGAYKVISPFFPFDSATQITTYFHFRAFGWFGDWESNTLMPHGLVHLLLVQFPDPEGHQIDVKDEQEKEYKAQ